MKSYSPCNCTLWACAMKSWKTDPRPERSMSGDLTGCPLRNPTRLGFQVLLGSPTPEVDTKPQDRHEELKLLHPKSPKNCPKPRRPSTHLENTPEPTHPKIPDIHSNESHPPRSGLMMMMCCCCTNEGAAEQDPVPKIPRPQFRV